MQKKKNNRILLKELFKNFCTRWVWLYIETRSQFINIKHFKHQAVKFALQIAIVENEATFTAYGDWHWCHNFTSVIIRMAQVFYCLKKEGSE